MHCSDGLSLRQVIHNGIKCIKKVTDNVFATEQIIGRVVLSVSVVHIIAVGLP